MKRTFCDRCGSECVYYHMVAHVMAVDTLRDMYVGEEEERGRFELCGDCTAGLEAWFGKSLHVLSPAELAEKRRQHEAALMAESAFRTEPEL